MTFRRSSVGSLGAADGRVFAVYLPSAMILLATEAQTVSSRKNAEGQVRELLDIFTWAASFEGCVLRPTWVSYS
jgi:hypothetical protein